MRFFTAVTLAVASLVSASPTDLEKRGLTNFDTYPAVRLNQVNASFGANRGLYYKGIGLAQIFDNGIPLQAVNAHSNPNTLVFGNLDKLQDDYPYITSKYTGSSGTFDLESFYYGCVSGNSAGRCTTLIAGYRNSTLVAGKQLDYVPLVRTGAPMVQAVLDSTWKGIDSVRFTTYYSSLNVAGATFLDDIRYTYYTGA